MKQPAIVHVPGDKSITHRALLLSALADGESRLDGLLESADPRSTVTVLRSLGVPVEVTAAGRASVPGRGLRGLRSPASELDCGNSGTTARLLLGVLAGSDVEAVLTGDASLRSRPMRRVTEPLSACGARFDELGEPDRLPIRVRGTPELEPIDVVNTRSSAQVKTAMLLAGLVAGVPVTVTEQGKPRDHTERMLGAMGAAIRSTASEVGDVIRLDPPDALEPLRLSVPGDISSAAFFLALGALAGPLRVPDVGLNPTRTGALTVMERMGVPVERELTEDRAGEPVGDVTVRPAGLVATTVRGPEIPTLLDEIPVLAALAVRAEGETRFEGIAELRVKETDRIAALAGNLRRLGVDVEEGPDFLAVQGTDRSLSGTVESFGDHRIAMAFGVLGGLPDNEIRVRGGAAVEISYPGFWEELRRVTQALETG